MGNHVQNPLTPVICSDGSSSEIKSSGPGIANPECRQSKITRSSYRINLSGWCANERYNGQFGSSPNIISDLRVQFFKSCV